MKTVEMCNLTESSSPDRKPRDLHNNTNTFRALHVKERERDLMLTWSNSGSTELMQSIQSDIVWYSAF